jgi:3-methyladenine DNA glycosylase AlkD
MIEDAIKEIKDSLKTNAPILTDEQKSRMYKILNSDNPNFVGYGNKHSDIEKLIREIQNKHTLSYREGLDIFKELIKSNVHDEKVAGIFLLNRFKKEFDADTIKMVRDSIPLNFDTWAITDTTMIRVIGPFLGKKGNDDLAKNVIEEWSTSENMWVRRASLVILLKVVMMKKEIEEDFVFNFAEKMLQYPEEYIHKGIGWLLKTCSKYDPDLIFDYLMENKENLPRLILRYSSEKLPKEKRNLILQK